MVEIQSSDVFLLLIIRIFVIEKLINYFFLEIGVIDDLSDLLKLIGFEIFEKDMIY